MRCFGLVARASRKPRVLRCFPEGNCKSNVFYNSFSMSFPKTTRFTMFSEPWVLKTACFTILFVPIFGKPRVLRCFPAPGRQIACFSRVLRRPLPKTTRFTMFSRPWALKVTRFIIYPGAHAKKSTRFTMLSYARPPQSLVLLQEIKFVTQNIVFLLLFWQHGRAETRVLTR